MGQLVGTQSLFFLGSFNSVYTLSSLHVCKLYTRVNLAHANWTLDRSKFQDQFSFSFLVQRGTFYVDEDNFELLFITRNKKKN